MYIHTLLKNNAHVSVVPSVMIEYHRGILSRSVYVTDNEFILITVVIKLLQLSRQTYNVNNLIFCVWYIKIIPWRSHYYRLVSTEI